MRVQCNKCHHRFDVPIRAVLTEAARIADRSRKIIPPAPDAPEANGNVLSPHDLEAKRLRDEAVRRRTNSPKI